MDQQVDNRPDDDALIVGQSAALSTQAAGFFVKTIGITVVVLLLWASFAKVDQVTRGTGRIVSQEKNSQVQHYEGGIVTQILVTEGQSVAEGDVLLRIENSFAQAELASSQLELGTERLRRARLIAETQDHGEIAFDEALAAAFPDQVAQETRLFESRR
ncbi:MAG: biotin/lipoyl-binding protein, partial [Pseudomonadota bacterium]